MTSTDSTSTPSKSNTIASNRRVVPRFVFHHQPVALGVLIAMLVCLFVNFRFANVLDYAGPNLAPNEILVYPPYNAVQTGPSGLCGIRST